MVEVKIKVPIMLPVMGLFSLICLVGYIIGLVFVIYTGNISLILPMFYGVIVFGMITPLCYHIIRLMKQQIREN